MYRGKYQSESVPKLVCHFEGLVWAFHWWVARASRGTRRAVSAFRKQRHYAQLLGLSRHATLGAPLYVIKYSGRTCESLYTMNSVLHGAALGHRERAHRVERAPGPAACRRVDWRPPCGRQHGIATLVSHESTLCSLLCYRIRTMRLVFWFYGLVVCRLMLIGYVERAMGVAGPAPGDRFFRLRPGDRRRAESREASAHSGHVGCLAMSLQSSCRCRAVPLSALARTIFNTHTVTCYIFPPPIQSR